MNPAPTSSAADVGRSKSFPGARSALVLLLLINLFNYLDRYVLAAVVKPIKNTFFGEGGLARQDGVLTMVMKWFEQSLGFKPEDALIGLLGTAFMLVYMVGAPLFARLAEQRSRWLIVGVGVIFWSLASGASGLAGSFVALLLTRCLVGVGEAAYGPVAPTVIADYYPVKVRGQVLAWFYMAIPVGSALGYVFGDWVTGTLFAGRPEAWRWAFYMVVVPGLVLGGWSLCRRDPPRGQADLGQGEKSAKVGWRDYLILLRTPSFVLCTLGMAAMTFAIGGISFWMPYYLEGRPGAPANSTRIFGAITAVAGLVATLLGGLAADKLRRRFAGSYFLVSGAAMIAGFPVFLGMLYLKVSFGWLWGLIFLTCFCLFFNTGPTNTIIANVTHPSLRAAGFAFCIFVIHALGDVISPVIIGLLNDYFHDMNKAFLVVGLAFLIAGVLWWWGTRYLARDTALAATRLNATHITPQLDQPATCALLSEPPFR
jgi:MFS family permease